MANVVDVVRQHEIDNPLSLVPREVAVEITAAAMDVSEATARKRLKEAVLAGGLTEMSESTSRRSVRLPGQDCLLWLQPSPPSPRTLGVTIDESGAGPGARKRHMVATWARVAELQDYRKTTLEAADLSEQDRERQVAYERDPDLGKLVDQLSRVLGASSTIAMWPAGRDGVSVTVEFRPGDVEVARRFLRGGLAALSE
ncbi:hypothetical protein ACFY2K_11695 [Kitasatospora sp. NPDC001309]|uniref:hypothetical protein n=1 Tax=Kitasatospora sp. NPDC001309 TaxID=3364013 RepID=UPI0036C5A152